MQFQQAIRSGFRNYAEFGGRAGRAEFWWWILFTALVSAALNALPGWPMMVLGTGAFHPGGGLAGAWSIAVLLPTLGLTVRRLRDAGYGWGNVFWLLLPLAGLIVLAVLCSQPSQPDVTGPRSPVPAGTTAGPAPRPDGD